MKPYEVLGAMHKRAYQMPVPAAAQQPASSAMNSAGQWVNRNKFSVLGGFAGAGMGLGFASVPVGIAGSWLGSKLDNHFNKQRDKRQWYANMATRPKVSPFNSLGQLGAHMIGQGMSPAPAAKSSE